MKLCKHKPHRVIDTIWEPRYHDDKILIHVDKVPQDIEHYIIRFSKEAPKEKYGWFYMSGKMIRRHQKQKNGKGEVYCVPLNKRETFIPDKNCNCMNYEFKFD